MRHTEYSKSRNDFNQELQVRALPPRALDVLNSLNFIAPRS
jgi:hypothetical protein